MREAARAALLRRPQHNSTRPIQVPCRRVDEGAEATPGRHSRPFAASLDEHK